MLFFNKGIVIKVFKMNNSVQLMPFNHKADEVIATAKIWEQEVEVFLDEDEFCDHLPPPKTVG